MKNLEQENNLTPSKQNTEIIQPPIKPRESQVTKLGRAANLTLWRWPRRLREINRRNLEHQIRRRNHG